MVTVNDELSGLLLLIVSRCHHVLSEFGISHTCLKAKRIFAKIIKNIQIIKITEIVNVKPSIYKFISQNEFSNAFQVFSLYTDIHGV